VFEAIFGWRQAEPTLEDLSCDLLHPDLVRALREAQTVGLSEDYRFPGNRRPYHHQLLAWRALKDSGPAQSVLVTSGTGSGKTECFLIPILNDLCFELEQRCCLADCSTGKLPLCFRAEAVRIPALGRPVGKRWEVEYPGKGVGQRS
jgi:ATP-dependent helicase YprA (DUF1998 family)